VQIDGESNPGAPPQVDAELNAIVNSIQFD